MRPSLLLLMRGLAAATFPVLFSFPFLRQHVNELGAPHFTAGHCAPTHRCAWGRLAYLAVSAAPPP